MAHNLLSSLGSGVPWSKGPLKYRSRVLVCQSSKNTDFQFAVQTKRTEQDPPPALVRSLDSLVTSLTKRLPRKTPKGGDKHRQSHRRRRRRRVLRLAPTGAAGGREWILFPPLPTRRFKAPSDGATFPGPVSATGKGGEGGKGRYPSVMEGAFLSSPRALPKRSRLDFL